MTVTVITLENAGAYADLQRCQGELDAYLRTSKILLGVAAALSAGLYLAAFWFGTETTMLVAGGASVILVAASGGFYGWIKHREQSHRCEHSTLFISRAELGRMESAGVPKEFLPTMEMNVVFGTVEERDGLFHALDTVDRILQKS